jgi:hypothetical protein
MIAIAATRPNKIKLAKIILNFFRLLYLNIIIKVRNLYKDISIFRLTFDLELIGFLHRAFLIQYPLYLIKFSTFKKKYAI